MSSCGLPTGERAVLIGAPQIEKSAGRVYAWTGGFETYLLEISADSMDWRFDGNSAEELGTSMTALGEGDSGAAGDWVALGASRNSITFTAAGAVYLTHSSDWWDAGVYSSNEEDDAWSVVYGEAEYADFGASVSAPGDVDGDGWPDVLVGQPRVDDEKLGFDVGGAVLWLEALPGI